MSTEENGSLGLTKKAIIKILNTAIANIDLRAGLTDAQVDWVKGKLTTVEGLVEQARTTITAINTELADLTLRTTALETKATQFQTALVNLTARVKALESKIE